MLLQSYFSTKTHGHTQGRKHRNEFIIFGWAVLPRPSCGPDLAASRFHLIGAAKDVIRGERFVSDDEIIEEVKKWLREQHSNWYRKRTEALGSRWRKAVEVDGDIWENMECYTSIWYPICMSLEFRNKVSVFQNVLDNLRTADDDDNDDDDSNNYLDNP
jgi:hypothetical protein